MPVQDLPPARLLGLFPDPGLRTLLARFVYQTFEEQKNIIWGVTHDLKNPIFNILSLASLLKSGLVKEETDDVAGKTEEAKGRVEFLARPRRFSLLLDGTDPEISGAGVKAGLQARQEARKTC